MCFSYYYESDRDAAIANGDLDFENDAGAAQEPEGSAEAFLLSEVSLDPANPGSAPLMALLPLMQGLDDFEFDF